MPLRKESYSFPRLTSETFRTLPGLFADSLPDKFGRKVINEYLISIGRDKNSLTPVEELLYIGKRGMGRKSITRTSTEHLTNRPRFASRTSLTPQGTCSKGVTKPKSSPKSESYVTSSRSVLPPAGPKRKPSSPITKLRASTVPAKSTPGKALPIG